MLAQRKATSDDLHYTLYCSWAWAALGTLVDPGASWEDSDRLVAELVQGMSDDGLRQVVDTSVAEDAADPDASTLVPDTLVVYVVLVRGTWELPEARDNVLGVQSG